MHLTIRVVEASANGPTREGCYTTDKTMFHLGGDDVNLGHHRFTEHRTRRAEPIEPVSSKAQHATYGRKGMKRKGESGWGYRAAKCSSIDAAIALCN